MQEILDKIMTFLKDEAFKIADFSIRWWYVIVAAAAVVVLLIAITIIVAVSKKKKKKKALKAKENEKIDNTSLSIDNNNDAKVTSEFSANKQPEQTEQVTTQYNEQPVAEVSIEKTVVAETEVIENNVVIEEPVATSTQQVVAEPVKSVENVESVRFVEKAPQPQVVEGSKPSEAIIAEKIVPVAKPIEVVEPQQTKVVQPTKVAEEVAPVKPVATSEPAKAPVQQTTTYTYVERPQQNNVVKQEPTQANVEGEKEAVATTAPRSLPKKTNKTTKKTAAQIANEIEEKTGSDPRKKTVQDKPAVVGQNKLPKKPKSKTTTSDNSEENELPIITTDPNVETFGKFVIIKNDDNSSRPYHFRLLANNGQILFESESYKTKPKSNSIVAFKKAAVEENFETDMDKAGNWRFKLYNNQHAVIGVGESYSTKQGCENSVQSVIKFAESARYLEDQTEENK